MSVEIRVPQMGESIVEATVGEWLKKPGDRVAVGEALVSLETDKVNQEIEAETSGVLEAITRQAGDTVGPNDVLGSISEVAETPVAEPSAPPQSGGSGRNGEAEPSVSATPVAQRIAEQNNVDLSEVTPVKPGRITKDDVAHHIERREAAPATAVEKAAEIPPRPAPAAPSPPPPRSDGRPEERVPMTRRRQTIARRLVEAQQSAAMLTTFNEVDMTAVMEIRKRRRDAFKERHGVSLGFMSFFTRAAIGALKAFPLLNAEIQENQIVLKRYYDIGVAVSTEEGLVVPVLRDADQKTFAGIETGIAELATRAREGKLTISELIGGTFTLTNGGVFGSLLSTPILNAPQVGILGMHKIQERPVALGGQVVIRPMMYLALSYDHRIVDGREAVQFLVRVKELIEDPEALLLEG